MSAIQKLDPNFVAPHVSRPDLVWYDGRRAPFSLHGHEKKESAELFCRIPHEVAAAMSSGVTDLNRCTAGIRLRFATDSPYVALRSLQPHQNVMPHMTAAGSAGFDLYADGVFIGGYFPDAVNMPEGCEGILTFSDQAMRQIEINFPLYSPVGGVYIGLAEGATVLPPRAYRHPKPVIYYGSSITQGGCAGRPGLSYQSHLCRWLDTDYRNLGFSGHALGEDVIAEYIAAQEMSAFVLDYDHNAPTPEHLQSTHRRFVDTVRKKHPQTPIVLASRPAVRLDQPEALADRDARRRIVLETYQAYRRSGDGNIYFVDGESFFPEAVRDACVVDNCHPNELGFLWMAMGFEKVLRPLLGEAGELHTLTIANGSYDN